MTPLVPTLAYLLAFNCGGVLAIGFVALALAHVVYRGVAQAIAARWDA